MKSTSRDWLNFVAGTVTATIIMLAALDATNAAAQEPTHQDIIASTLILEAGGEYSRGAMEAVHEVIYNRSIKRNKSMSDICLQKWQFSCWNGKNIEENVAKAKNHSRWNKAMKIILSQNITNFTNGADHYHANYIDKPYWADSMNVTAKIGRHIFYK